MNSSPIDLRIEYLADHPNLIKELALWFHDEWGIRNPKHSIANISRNLQERMNRDMIPLTLVGFIAKEPVASTSIKLREMDTFPDYEHWLSAVYVVPQFRGRGFGKRMVRRVMDEARRLNLECLYLYTETYLEKYFAKLGWSSIKTQLHNGREIVVMRQLFL